MKASDNKKPVVKKASPAKRPSPAKPNSVKKTANQSGKNEISIKGIFTRIGLTLSQYAGKIVTYALNIFLTVFLIGIITGSAVACALVIYIKNYVDPVFDVENLKYNSSLTTSLYYQEAGEDGNNQWVEWEEERIYGTENRLWVSYEKMPEDLINAFVSIEDHTFFVHDGINVRRTFGAVLGFVAGKDSYGGSTITQQLIKNVTGEDDVTIQRKIQEILRALNFESKRSKEEILEMYLNTIYLSQGCYGVSAASYKYFGKDVSELTLVECAALAAIPKAPTKYDPIQNPDNNRDRRDTVLITMYDNNYIEKTYTLEEIRAAREEELVLNSNQKEITKSNVHSWFVDTMMDDVIADLQSTYGYDKQTASNILYSGGLKIYLTMDKNVQDIMDSVYQNDANFPSKGTGVPVESAMTVIDQKTGNIVGIVGGRGVKDSPRPFNRATMAKRQPGSSIKPLSAYSVAIEKGLINYSTVIDDTPFRFNGEGTPYPNNWNFVFDGLCTIYDAVRNSKNTVAMKVVDMIGVQASYDFLVNKYHLSTLVKSDIDYAPLALGGFTYGVTVRDMATAYAAIANSGMYNTSKTYTKILDSNDNILLENNASPEVILSEDTAAVTTRLLQDVVSAGTGTAVTLKSKINCAGKTGTTNDNNDLYFCGYTPYYTAACWVGYDTPKALSGFTSGQTRVSAALYLWDTVMTQIHQKQIEAGNALRFTDYLTKQLVTRTYCKDSGLLVGDACGLDLRGRRTATGYYAPSNIPSSTCDTHVPVSYCNDTNCVAGPGCTNTRTISLVRVDRTYPSAFAIGDVQYTYRDVPTTGYYYPTDTHQPFYGKLYADGEFYGTAKTDKYANAFCYSHNPASCIPGYQTPTPDPDPDPEQTDPPAATAPSTT